MKKTKKHNTFKTKLVISYIILAVMVASIISFVDYINIFSLTEKQTFFSIKTIETLSRINSNLHVKYLSPFARQFIILKAESIADEIEKELSNSGGYSGINSVKNNPKIKEIVDRNIEIEGETIGNIIMINSNKDIILAGNHEIEGRNYKEIQYKYPELYKLVAEGTKKLFFDGYYEILTNSVKERRKFLAAVKIQNTPLYIIAAIHVNTYMNPLFNKLKLQEGEEITSLLKDLNKFFNSSLTILLLISVITLSAIIIVSLFISNLLARTIANPILKLNRAAEKLAKGNFNIHVKEEGTNETIQLAKTFNHLGKDIQNYITKLENEISHREQIEGEINAARKIQRSQLPNVTDNFTRKEFSLYADLLPAKNVAGDFYDFFYIDDEKTKLALLIGDVSGKGIPASFFMGVAKTIIKSTALSKNIKTPGELLSEVNNVLCFDNTEVMFVSLFLIFYDIQTGKMLYSNAGHHPALKLINDSTIEQFGEINEPLLGLFKDVVYSTSEEILNKGESIVLFTDGITEAYSIDTKQTFDEKNLYSVLLKHSLESPAQICKNTFESVVSFQNSILFDDITMIILKNLNGI